MKVGLNQYWDQNIRIRIYDPISLFFGLLKAAEDFLTKVHTRQDSRHSFTSQLWLTFKVTEGIFDKAGRLTLTCNASLSPFYHTNTSIVLHNPLLRRAHNSGLFSSGDLFFYLPSFLFSYLIESARTSMLVTIFLTFILLRENWTLIFFKIVFNRLI